MSASSEVGRRLKAERERLEFRRVDVSRATGIYAHHLAAIEFGRFDDLPDDRAVEEAVRAYAEHLGLDGPASVTALRAERGITAAPPLAPAAAPRPETRRTATRAFGAIALVVALGAVGAWWTAEREEVVEPRMSAAPVAPIPEARVERAPAAPPEPRPMPESRVPSLSVTEHGVGTAVEDHRLIGSSDRFAEGTRVWFWTKVEGGAVGDSVLHFWMRNGREVLVVPLSLGGPRWRTQSSRTLGAGSAGEWTVEARDEDGNVLARDRFTCGGASRPRERGDVRGEPSSG